MIYASLKAAHLLGVVVWVGGMFFMLAILRPAAMAVLEGPTRARLMHATQGRFFDAVTVAALVVLLSGAAMLGVAWRTAASAGLRFNMPLDWYVMTALFVVMAAVFAHVRLVLFTRLSRAVAAEAWPQAAKALDAIRAEVGLNLALGVFVVIVVRLGAVA